MTLICNINNIPENLVRKGAGSRGVRFYGQVFGPIDCQVVRNRKQTSQLPVSTVLYKFLAGEEKEDLTFTD